MAEKDASEYNQMAFFVRGHVERIFAYRVKEAEEVQALLAKIVSMRRYIPRARGSIQVRSIDDWFGSYRKQIVWDVSKVDEIVRLSQLDPSVTKREVIDKLKTAVLDINTELGLVEIKLSDDASVRVNVSRPLQNTQKIISTLKHKLRGILFLALAESVDQTFEVFFRSADDAERALNDDFGSVAFQEENGLIEISPGHDGDRADLRMLVADALADVCDPYLLDRVEQRNRHAADLVRGYAERFEADSSTSDLLLYSSGVKLSQAMPYIMNPEHEDEQVPKSFLIGLGTLIVHHEAYIWSVPRLREVIELRRKTRESYSSSPIEKSSIQTDLLEEVSKAQNLVGARTRTAIADVNALIKGPTVIGVGLEAMQYGLLRGALQFMGRAIVQTRKETIRLGQSTLKKVAVNATATAIATSPL